MTTRPCPSARDRAEPAHVPSAVSTAWHFATLAGAAVLGTLLLAGCGGGGGDDAAPAAPPPVTPSDAGQVPASAAATTPSSEAYAIAQAPNDRIQPLRLDHITSVPTSETEEPIALLP